MGEENLQAISAYVPKLIVHQVMAVPDAPLVEYEERLESALLFADVSGFTAMSESLAQLGKEGAEELTRIINTYFSRMTDLVHRYSGQVVKFGGDAMTCAFTAKSATTNRDLLIRRACTCALAMQTQMEHFRALETRGGTFTLQMKIGISAGTVLSLVVGDLQQGLECVLAGRPLDRMAEAEHHARAGEVLIDGDCLLHRGIIVAEERETFLLVRDVETRPETGQRFASFPNLAESEPSRTTDGRFLLTVQETYRLGPSDAPYPSQEIDWSALDEEIVEQTIVQLTPFIPPKVYEQIMAGQRKFLGEHRPVVSLFVNFSGLDYDGDPNVAGKLRRYFAEMQLIVRRYGGRLNRVMTGDKGSLLHVIFGAPVAHEDNEERAVGCALAMQDEIAHSETLSFIIEQRIGIAAGSVFAGAVGSQRRREYTVMGDAVNLSARLMQAAGVGEILIDYNTAHRAKAGYVCQALSPIQVKGKRDPIPVYCPQGVREEAKVWHSTLQEQRRTTPLVGRDQELARVDNIIERVMARRGQLLIINGEAGVGKSRLLEEIVVLAREREPGLYGLGGDCLSYGTQTPYLPWVDLFSSHFELTDDEFKEQNQRVRAIIRRMVAVDTTLEDWVPLMGQLLGLPVPDNALTASLDPQLRKQRTFDVALQLLHHQARQVPLFLIVIEDVHWIDAISLEMLEHVARNIADFPILLIVIQRPTIDLSDWQRYGHYNYLELTDLPVEDALKLVKLKLGLDDVPPSLCERVVGGEMRVNPFFVEELLNTLIDQGYLKPRKNGAYALLGDLAQADIPDSIQALVMSRIDRLDESSKLTVKVASVVGRTFKYLTLKGIYPMTISSEKLWANLNQLSKLDLTPLDRPEPEWEYIFKHIITQEVAYESLLFSHRRTLHRRVGEYLERTHSEGLEEYYELLAHHYCRSGEQERCWDYLVKAGDKAREKYANEAAIAHYTQALALSSDVEGTARHAVYESLGDVYRHVGQYEQAETSYRAALDHRLPTAAQVADVRRKIAKTWELQGRYDEAISYLQLAREALGDEQWTPELARIYGDMGWVAMRQGRYEEALNLCQRGMNVSGRLAGSREEIYAVQTRLAHALGTIYLRMGDYAQAITHFEACITMQEDAKDFYHLSRSYNNLAVVYWSRSNYGRAAQYIQKSLEINRKLGNTYGIAMCYNNLGGIAYVLGDYAEAIDRYEKSLEIRCQIGDTQGIADVYNNLGEVHHSLDNDLKALDYLRKAVELFLEIGDKRTLIDAYRLLAEIELALAEVDSALDHGQSALDLALEIGNQEYEAIGYRVLGQVYRAQDKMKASKHRLQKSVTILRSLDNKLEVGRSIYELGLTLVASDDERGRENLEEAAQLFEKLGAEADLEKARNTLEGL